MSFKYFTDEFLEQFSGGAGDVNILEALDSYDSNNPETEDEIVFLYTELILSLEEGKIKIDHLIDFLNETIRNDDFARIFCQVLNSFPVTENMKYLLSTLYRTEKVIKLETIAAYIGTDFLKESGIIPGNVLSKSLNMKLRDKLYTQKKYNLLVEEIEGYSKFIIELHSIFTDDTADFQIDYALQISESLIGHYNLDPNRCLNIILDILINNVVRNWRAGIAFLKKSRWWPSIEADNSSLNTLTIGGNLNASKMVGLELLDYSSSKDLSENFKLFVTILIREQFISFGSFYKYLRPDENAMKEIEQEYNKKLEEDVSKAGANALALAAPLADEDDKPQTSTLPANNTTKIPSATLETKLLLNLKFQFLKIFLSTGLYWPAIFILTDYPYLATIDDEIQHLLCKVFGATINNIYEQNNVRNMTATDASRLKTARGVSFARPGNNVIIENQPPPLISTFRALSKDYPGKSFIYIVENWADTLPIVNDFKSLLKVSKEILKFIGTNLSKDVSTFTKLCAIVRSFQSEEELKDEIFHYFRNYIFPVMPLLKHNSFAIDAAYSILAQYPIEDRFSVYGELYNNLRKNNNQIKIAYSIAEKETKDVLKRLSKENVKPMMRRLAKICSSNPLPCLLTILQQIESYDNLISLVVETAKYFNEYVWDNLTIAILIRLSSDRSSTHDNGMLERQWLQSLASFVGKICQSYPKKIDVKTIITYVLKSFYSGDRIGLLVLKEMFTSMGGIKATSDLTLRQIDAINCGSSLQRITYRTIDDLRYRRIESGQLLLKCFIDLDAVNELIVLLCSIYDDLIFGDEESHLKVLASRADDLSAVIKLFTTLVSFFGRGEDTNLMSINDLHNKYNVPISSAFDLWRTKSVDLESIESQAQEVVPNNFPTSLFTAFWYFSLRDINYDENLYVEELDKLESATRGLKDAVRLNARNKDFPIATLDKYEREIIENTKFIEQIPSDKVRHKELNDAMNQTLSELSSNWFNSTDDMENTQNEKFVQYCLMPRAIHSSFDAVFAARFVFKLNELHVDNYSLFGVLSSLLDSDQLYNSLYSSTPSEAENLGYFFAFIFKHLQEINNEESVKALNLGELSEFKNWVFTFHSSILEQIKRSLEVDEYISRSNTIVFLKNLLGVYPLVDDHCENLVTAMEQIYENDEKEDIKLASGALLGHIKSKSKQWIPIWDFIPMSDEEKQKIIDEREKIKKEQEEIEKKAKEEEEKKIAELNKEKQAKEEEELRRKKAATAINYSSTSGTGNRTGFRSQPSSSARRYEAYQSTDRSDRSKYNATKDHDDSENKEEDRPSSARSSHIKERLSKMKSEYLKAKSSEPKEDDMESVKDVANGQDDVNGENAGTNTSESENPGTTKSTNSAVGVETEKEIATDRQIDKSDSSNTQDKTNNGSNGKSDTRRKSLPSQEELIQKSTMEAKQPQSIPPSNPRRTPLPAQGRTYSTGEASTKPDTRGYHQYNSKSNFKSNEQVPPPPPPPSTSAQPSNFGRRSYGTGYVRHDQNRQFNRFDNNNNNNRSYQTQGYDSRSQTPVNQRPGYGNNPVSGGSADTRAKYRTPTYDNRKAAQSSDSSQGDQGNKRRADGGQGGRSYDKKQRY
ncbi:RLR1 [Candida pseudojiufengensis]|uniref:RLR1 n=1 Tax=Candida pseudojiufengensis TaxID=497109 RepID=UPI00222522D2|nr:RLR1 [Candida pseudojiufengensis]KAI5959008.1 RLR1 [Candida pseudojiufengensis]